jgi:hypothetical protein
MRPLPNFLFHFRIPISVPYYRNLQLDTPGVSRQNSAMLTRHEASETNLLYVILLIDQIS